MGRTLLAEPHIHDGLSTSFKSAQSGVGMIIGQLALQKDYVVHLARTPCEEEENKADPAPLSKVDDKWIATHARQVMRMLTGGLNIIGIFAYGPPDAMKQAQTMLRKAVFAVHKVEVKEQYRGLRESADTISDRYVLQICSVTKKSTCRTFDVSDPKCGGKPAEYKQQTYLDKWSKVEMSMKVDTSFQVSKSEMSETLERQMQIGFEPIMDNIMNGMALFNNNVRDPSESLVSSPGAVGGGGGGKKKKAQQAASQESFKVKLLCPPVATHKNEKPTQVDCVASMVFNGSMYGVAYVHSKATVKEAAYAIKQDFIRSLQARYELLCEDLLQTEESNDPRIIYEMPVRVFSHLNNSTLTLCDFLFPEEELQYSSSRFAEFLDLAVDEDEVIQDNERFPTEEDIEVVTFTPGASSSESFRQRSVVKGGTAKKATNLLVVGLSSAVAALAAALSYMYLGDQ